MNEPLLSFRDFSVSFDTDSGEISAVRNINWDLFRGETVAVVGESGAGKSQLFHAMLGLQGKNALVSGDVVFEGVSLPTLSNSKLNQFRGARIGMIFQDPMTALNPYLRIGKQLTEVLEAHQKISPKAAKRQAMEMLEKVQLNDVSSMMKHFPHQLSGGMRQRVMIAMTLLCKPDIIIADEPTTALDVTVQSDIIKLLSDLHAEHNMSIVLITHDLPLVSGLCEKVVIMYAGKMVEQIAIDDLHHQALHPYTQALLASIPGLNHEDVLKSIDGHPPSPLRLPEGCAFHPRCHRKEQQCSQQQPILKAVNGNKGMVACFNPREV